MAYNRFSDEAHEGMIPNDSNFKKKLDPAWFFFKVEFFQE